MSSLKVRIRRSAVGRRLAVGVFIFLLFIGPVVSISTAADTDRFRLMGDGKIRIKNCHTGQTVSVSLLNSDGTLNDGGFCEVDRVFGFPTAEKGEHICPRLIFMLDYFSDLIAPGKTINMISGYRSPNYNTNLRDAGGNVAKTSLHMDGMALDFNIDGVSGKKMWEIIRARECAGVGHYGGANIHLDSGRPRFWEAATSKVRTTESDNNRKIWLSTDFDRYRPGDTARLSFSSVSDFDFGVKPIVAIVGDPEGKNVAATAQIRLKKASAAPDCAVIGDRGTSRFLFVALPPDLRAGKYRIKVEFCRRPFEEMPQSLLSNEIELSQTLR